MLRGTDLVTLLQEGRMNSLPVEIILMKDLTSRTENISIIPIDIAPKIKKDEPQYIGRDGQIYASLTALVDANARHRETKSQYIAKDGSYHATANGLARANAQFHK